MQSIEEIYEQYFETVKKYLCMLTKDYNIAEDLTQETFCRAVKNINSFKGECKISVWLCQIAKNLWYNEIKKTKKVDFVNQENACFDIIQNETEDMIIQKENIVEIYKKLQKLDEKTREVIYLRITGELSFKEIATILNQSENWARVTFYRGKQKLKEVDENEKL